MLRFHRLFRLFAAAAGALALLAGPASTSLAQGMGGALSPTTAEPAGAPARWEAEMRAQLDKLNATGLGVEDHMAMAELLTLLDLPRQAYTAADDITGKWRIRSLQVSQYGVYAYPFLSGAVTPGTTYLGFNKSTGSQRRAGTLRLEGDGGFAFLGGDYMAGDPVGGHSSLKLNPTEEDRYRDSEGVMIKLGAGHALLIFASKFFQGETYSGEIYELRR